MQEDQTSVLPKQGVPDFPPSSPTLVDTEQVQPESSVEGPISPAFSCVISSSPVPPSLASGIPELDDFYADTERAYRAHDQTQPTSQQRMTWQAWANATRKKHELALKLLEVQKVIEKVENEAAQYLTRGTIARLRQERYKLGGGDTPDDKFISAISALKLTVY